MREGPGTMPAPPATGSLSIVSTFLNMPARSLEVATVGAKYCMSAERRGRKKSKPTGTAFVQSS
jgi:hypothetical protein